MSTVLAMSKAFINTVVSFPLHGYCGILQLQIAAKTLAVVALLVQPR